MGYQFETQITFPYAQGMKELSNKPFPLMMKKIPGMLHLGNRAKPRVPIRKSSWMQSAQQNKCCIFLWSYCCTGLGRQKVDLPGGVSPNPLWDTQPIKAWSLGCMTCQEHEQQGSHAETRMSACSQTQPRALQTFQRSSYNINQTNWRTPFLPPDIRAGTPHI